MLSLCILSSKRSFGSKDLTHALEEEILRVSESNIVHIDTDSKSVLGTFKKCSDAHKSKSLKKP